MKPLVSDALWEKVAPLLPPEPKPGKKGGRKVTVSNRQAFTGILFVLRTALAWQMLPLEMNCGSGSTCWRRFNAWTKRGVWKRLHKLLLRELSWAGEIDWSRAALDSSTVAAKKRGNYIGPNPTDKGRAGCKRPLVVDATGIPLAVRLSAANVNDCQRVAQMLDAIPALPHRGPGRPRRRPGKMHADKGYDFKKCRHACRVRGITPRIARRGIESSERLGRYRWVVERDFAWLNALRRLRTRYDRFARHYIGFLDLGRALICWNYLSKL
ncbi:MAG: IS5 family transposase [Nitrospira sp.]|nr:IS5 family transposase [Nitrospira sp.]